MTMRNYASKASSLLGALLFSVCGIACNENSSPTGANGAQGSLALELRSGKELVGLQSSVSGMATVGSVSQQVVDGRASFENVMVGSPVQFRGGSFVSWSSSAQNFGTLSAYLWPNDSFLSESDIREMVYRGSNPKLYRAVGTVYVAPGDFSGNDVLQALSAATAMLNEALGGGGVRFIVTDSPPAGAVVITSRLDPTLPTRLGNPDTKAAANCGFDDSYRQTGGGIHYVDRASVLTPWIAAHELTHCFGMRGHNPSPGLMNAGAGNTLPNYTDKERVVLRMMLQREPGGPIG